MLASTSFFTKEGGGEAYVTVWKQVMWVGLSIAACVVTALIDYNRWYKWRWWALGIAVLGMMAVLLNSAWWSRKGAIQWRGRSYAARAAREAA
jgi:cell division protein FtsW (lipid II flippase)